jgi:subtilisin family serine protease
MRWFRPSALTAALAATAVFSAPSPASSAPAPDSSGARLVRVIVTTGPGVGSATARAQASEAGGSIGHVYRSALHGYSATVPVDQIDSIRNQPGVEAVELDQLGSAGDWQSPTPSWGLDRVDQRNLPLSGSYGYQSTGVGVTDYIFDTGVRLTHTDFTGRIRSGPDYVDDDLVSDDCHGHGTHVAGTSAGTTYGVAKKANIVAVRVLDCSGFGWYSDWIAAIDWINSDHQTGQPAVVNASLGGGYSDALNSAVSNSIADGIVWVVAAMNNNADACSYSPASVPNAITVGATDAADARASFSDYGPCVDIFAPGVDITSAGIASDTASAPGWSGTSMATPHVVGAALLYLGQHPGATPAQTASALLAAATQDKVTDSLSASDGLLYIDPGPPPTANLSITKTGTGTGVVSSSPAGINCGSVCTAPFAQGSSVTLTASSSTGSAFGGWSGACTGTSTTCVVNMTGAQSVTASFTAVPSSTKFEESAAAFSGWKPFTDSVVGPIRGDTVTGETVQFKFSGSSVTWLTKKGPGQGKASVTIDGASKGTIDLYAAAAQSAAQSFSGLGTGSHTLVLKVLGTKNASATGTQVVVRGFTVGATTSGVDASGITYHGWKGVSAATASGGSYRSCGTANRSASFQFSGTAVDWITATGPGWGRAEVTIDGVSKGTVDLYAASAHPQTVKTYAGLGTGTHKITITALGTKNSLANSTNVQIDAFVTR